MTTNQSQAPLSERRKPRAESERLLSSQNTHAADMTTAHAPQRVYGNSRLAGAAMRGAHANPSPIVQRARLVVQPKLALGPVDDAYEREADSVAQSVVQQLAAPPQQASADAISVQRASEEEEEMLQGKRTPAIVQRVAEEEEEMLQGKRTPAIVQRASEEEEMLQGKRTPGPEASTVDPALESQIQRARAGGSALEPAARSSMEGAIGSDFSRVRIHTGQESDALNRSLSARAFTTGSDIFFRAGEYNPGSSQGQQLLAHELTHVVQQGAAGARTQRMPQDLQRKRAARELFFGGSFA